MIPILKPKELIALYPNQNLVLIDVRSGPGAKEKYTTAHLAGARFVDLEKDLSDKKADAAEGGRHPLPDSNKFAQVLGHLGIRPESHVVAYDDKNGANAAARFWWMLKALGHNAVQVLDGGYEAAVAASVPTSSQNETAPTYPPYPHSGWQLPTVNIEEVAQTARNPEFLLIDVREAERYRGEKEPIDLVAGHIPGAVNIPFSTNLDANGFFLPPEELLAKYAAAIQNRPPENIAVHCGSGVTACHTLLAMNYAGLAIPNLYVGSWSEWSRNDRPIATES